MNSGRLDVDQPVLRTLLCELSSAALAIEAALVHPGHDEAREDFVRTARDALEVFQQVERSSRPFAVPQRTRRHVAWALSELASGRLELADADVRRAGGSLERSLPRGEGQPRPH